MSHLLIVISLIVIALLTAFGCTKLDSELPSLEEASREVIAKYGEPDFVKSYSETQTSLFCWLVTEPPEAVEAGTARVATFKYVRGRGWLFVGECVTIGSSI